MPALQLKNLRAAFDSTDVLVIDDQQIDDGEFLSVVGPSGCGKSTLLRLIAGLLTPSAGQVLMDDQRDPSVRTGFVFQDATLLPWRTAAANIALPGELEGQPLNGNRLAELADLVGLTTDDLQKRPGALSGGMKMRVSLARALALEPQLLLLDEPFAALDDLLRQQLQQDVRRIQQTLTVTAVLVTHNVTEAVAMSDRVWSLGGHPASVTRVTQVPSERPGRSSPEFASIVDSVMSSLQIAGGTVNAQT